MKNRLTTIFIAAVAMAALTAPPVLAKADKGNKGKDKQEFNAESKKEFKQDRIHPAQRGQSDKARSRSAVESQTARRDAAPALQKERALRELKFQNRSHLNMLDPFGHDRESDRKALYGNNGRVVRAIEPTPDPVPDPDPLPDPDPEPTPEPGDPEPGSPEPEPGDPGGDSGSDDGESPPPSNPEPEAIMVPSMPF